MNIEHKLEPIEHWIVDGKAYRLATEQDVGKLCYRSDSPSFEQALRNNAPLTIKAYIAGSDRPFVVFSHWKYAYVQDDSLITQQRTPVPALGDGWFLLWDDEVIQKGDMVSAVGNDIFHQAGSSIGKPLKDYGGSLRAARYFGPASSEPQEVQAKDTDDTPKPIDWTKPVRTKDGRAVRVLCTDGPGDYPVVGLVDGMDDPRTWTISGQYFTDGPDHENDLENAPQRIQREYWVNVYSEHDALCAYESKSEANRFAIDDRFACVKIIIDCEEGEGL